MKNGMAPMSRLRNTIRTERKITNVHFTLSALVGVGMRTTVPEGVEVHTMVHEEGEVSTTDPEEEDLWKKKLGLVEGDRLRTTMDPAGVDP